MKIAHIQVPQDCSRWDWKPMKLTGNWKIIIDRGETTLYLEEKGWLINRWIHESNIEIFEEKREYINDCNRD